MHDAGFYIGRTAQVLRFEFHVRCAWCGEHVKTEMALDDGKTRAAFEWDRVFTMFARQGFRGYRGLEYEAAKDPVVTVPRYLRTLRAMALKYSA